MRLTYEWVLHKRRCLIIATGLPMAVNERLDVARVWRLTELPLLDCFTVMKTNGDPFCLSERIVSVLLLS